MKYDDLVERIYTIHNDSSDPGEDVTKQYKGMVQFMQALCAVVELSKPNGYESTEAIYWKQAIRDAIKKELK